MRRFIITMAVTVAVTVSAVAVAAAVGGGSSITRARLERAVPVVFANQYARQAALLGHHDITAASIDAKAMCDKHGPDVPDVGPGSDWVCLMSWNDPNVPMPNEGYGKFELSVANTNCFTVGGPSKLVGFATITDVDGHDVANPVAEFDGCFDPVGDNTPTGVTFPSLLGVPSTVVSVTADGSVSVQLTCGTGAEGCGGSVAAAATGDRALGTVPYALRAEHGALVTFPEPLPPDATDVTLTFTPQTGVAPVKPVTVKVQG